MTFAPVEITKAVVTQIEDAAYAAVPSALTWAIGANTLRAAIAYEVARDIERCRDWVLAQRFHAEVPWLNASIEDFLPKILALPSGALVCASIRFRPGPEPLFPPQFSAQSSPKSSHKVSSESHKVSQSVAAPIEANGLVPFIIIDRGLVSGQSDLAALAQAFEVFCPHFVSAFCFGEAPPEALVKTTLVAGLVAHEKRPFWVSERVRVDQTQSLSFYPSYLAIYADFHRLRPDLVVAVRVEPIETFEQALQTGLICTVWVDDVFAGVMSAERCTHRYLEGFYVTEKVVDPRHWGTGLGESLEWLFTRHLPAGVWITGEVDLANRGSLGSARRNGRTEVGTKFGMPLPR